MNHIYKRILSASLSLLLVGSLSYGTAGATFRQDFESISKPYTDGMTVYLTNSMIHASQNKRMKIIVAIYDQNGKMTSMQVLPFNQEKVVLSGAGSTYKIFCLNDKWASAENSYRKLSLNVEYGNKSHGVEYSYDVHNDLRAIINGSMNKNNTVLSLGIQEFLKSLQNAGYLDAQGNILSDGKFLSDNWDKLFDRFEGYVSSGDDYYKTFKNLLSFDDFVTETISDSGIATYSLNHTGFPDTLAGCAEYLTPKFKELVLASYDVMIHSAPANDNEDALIDRISTILESRLTGVTASASKSIQIDGDNTPITLTKEDFVRLAKLLRKDCTTPNRTIEIISVIETLRSDRLDIQKTINSDTLTSNVIRLFNVTDEITKEKLKELFRNFPSCNLHMILDFDTAFSQSTTQPTEPTGNTPVKVVTALKNASYGLSTISYSNTQMDSVITTLKSCIDTTLSEHNTGTVITKEYFKTRFATEILAIKSTYSNLNKNSQSRILNDIANSVNLATLTVIQDYFLS